jgi:hypothetical protein
MVKVLNAVFGIGIAVVVYILILLGIQAFYPEARYEDYCNQSMYAQPVYTGYESCLDNITVGECRSLMKTDSVKVSEDQKCWEAYDTASKNYNKYYFIIASILGVIVILVAFLLINIINISAGIACAGIVLIMYAFIRSWTSTDDMLKFIVGLIIAAIVITLAVVVNKKISKK